MRKRTHLVQFRLNDTEIAQFNNCVQKSGFTRAAYLRSLIQGLVPQNKPPPDYFAMTRELHAIGTNLNQIAHKAHALGDIDAQHYDKQARNLADTLIEITTAVKEPRRL